MKNKTISIVIIAIVIASISAFTPKKENPDIEFPGTTFIKDSLFFDISEIRTVDWREFVYWTKKNKGEFSLEYKNTIPDSTVWDGRNISYQSIYFRHSSYRDYPVVGIRYDQAVAFCKWRTDRVKEMFDIKKKKNPKMYLPNFRYRLPTKEEWLFIANAGCSEKTQKEIEKTIKKDPSKDPNKQDIINPCNSLWPNKFGIYDMNGNVSEFVQEKGIAMGANFNNNPNQQNIEQKITSVQIENWLGFRCVCEIIE